MELEFVRVTGMAAIAAAKWVGKGDGKAADKAAVDAMRQAFNQIDFSGRSVLCEGDKDESFSLAPNEKLGTGSGLAIDIAADPLECTDSVAYGRPNALSVIVTAPRDTIYKAVDSYMKKIGVGPSAVKAVDLDAPTKDNVVNVAKALGKDVSEVTVAILDRPRHGGLIDEIRKVGARVQLFTDGDVAMAIATCLPESPIDLMMGVGGSTEAVLAAAALKCYGGQLLCRWQPKQEHLARLQKGGITDADLSKLFTVNDFVQSDDTTFTATGVITGPLLDGVVFRSDKIITHSLVISCKSKTIRVVKTVQMVSSK